MFLLKKIKTKKSCGTLTSLDDKLFTPVVFAKHNDKPVSAFSSKRSIYLIGAKLIYIFFKFAVCKCLFTSYLNENLLTSFLRVTFQPGHTFSTGVKALLDAAIIIMYVCKSTLHIYQALEYAIERANLHKIGLIVCTGLKHPSPYT